LFDWQKVKKAAYFIADLNKSVEMIIGTVAVQLAIEEFFSENRETKGLARSKCETYGGSSLFYNDCTAQFFGGD
jgi:hypothetical protein